MESALSVLVTAKIAVMKASARNVPKGIMFLVLKQLEDMNRFV